MSLLSDLRRSAGRSPRLIGPDTCARCRDFLLSRRAADGGFRGLGDESDLYYTGFALLALDALAQPVPDGIHDYLRAQASGPDLDLVHTANLIRCGALAELDLLSPDEWRRRIDAFAAENGGYSEKPGATDGTAYGAFLAVGALDDLGLLTGADDGIVLSLQVLRQRGGGFANETGIEQPAANATAAAVVVLDRLGIARETLLEAGRSLLAAQAPEGGFRATPGAPIPDLLSTATALHALSVLGMGGGFDGERTLQMIESLSQDDGGFCAHWADTTTDVEYTFYGLLAVGSLIELAESTDASQLLRPNGPKLR